MFGTMLIVFLVMALLAVLPRWSHSRSGAMARRVGSASFCSSSLFSCFSAACRARGPCFAESYGQLIAQVSAPAQARGGGSGLV